MQEGATRRTLDVLDYWRVVRRWWWLVSLGIVVGGLAGYLWANAQTPIYQARAKVLIEGAQSPGLPNFGDIQTNQQLAETYSELIGTRAFSQGLAERLGVEGTPDARARARRSFVDVYGRNPDPVMAADIANAAARLFTEEVRDRQFTQIAQFQLSLGQYGVSQDPSVIAAQAAKVINLSVVEEAVVPSSPASPNTKRLVLLLAVLGLVGSVSVVVAKEHLDDHVRSSDELQKLTGLPVVGSVLRYNSKNMGLLVVLSRDHHSGVVVEGYNFLRTNLDFASLGVPQGFKSLLVTSALPGEGKTTTAANLAVSFAKEGKSVVLVDCDLRRPALHKILGQSASSPGLTKLLLGQASVSEALSPTMLDSLKFVSSGPLPPEPSILLRAAKLPQVMEQLKAQADLVIFDSPPLLRVADPMLLARHVDFTLLVVDIVHTNRQAAAHAVTILRHATQGSAGLVLNKVVPKGGGDYYYSYYSKYYSQRSSDTVAEGLEVSKDGASDGAKRSSVQLGRLLGKTGRERSKEAKSG